MTQITKKILDGTSETDSKSTVLAVH